MTIASVNNVRAGQSNIALEQVRAHTLIILVEDRPGSADRVLGVLRRRRAQPQSVTLSRTETTNIIRISAQVRDSEVSIEQLVEQVRKITDVQQVQNVTSQEAIERESILVKLGAASGGTQNEISAIAQRYGASVIDTTSESITLACMDTQEQIAQVLQALQPYTIRELARSGSLVVVRDR